jgi:membrane peptidoglycan carboxypeptidase
MSVRHRVRAADGGAAPDHPARLGERGQPAHPGQRGRPLRRRILRRSLIVVSALIFTGILAFAGLLLIAPSVGNAEALARAQDRVHQAAFPGPPVPPRFAAAIVATEDHRFGYEPGIDPFAIARVSASWLTGGGARDQGGATIYQQLAKLLYTPGRSGAAVELEQVSLAVKLFMTYSSQQILQMYSEVAYFGNGDYGLAAASCGYFGIPPRAMSWPQAALLAGLVQGPSADDPLQHPVRARQREVHVIGRLAATGEITRQQASAALAQPLARLIENAGSAGGHCVA